MSIVNENVKIDGECMTDGQKEKASGGSKPTKRQGTLEIQAKYHMHISQANSRSYLQKINTRASKHY